MATRKRGQNEVNGEIYNSNGSIGITEPSTKLSHWRLRDEKGRQTWHYLTSEEETKAWPISVAEKYHLGLDTGLPILSKPKTALDAARNGLEFFSHQQLPPGNWGCQYGGPMFLLPGLVIVLHVTGMPLLLPEQTEIIRYIFNMQNVGSKNGGDGGWGLHIEGDSTVFGTAMNYTTLRLLGVPADDPRMQKARACLLDLGGALHGPHWAKFWLALLGVVEWDAVNPVPPELWLLPDWVPISPWRWWIHMRQVYLPMSLLWSKRWVYPDADKDPVIRELRQELFNSPHDKIVWSRYRNTICTRDNYNPKSWVLNVLNLILALIYVPFLRISNLVRWAEDLAWHLVQIEDANTDYGDLAPVNSPMNFLVCFVEEGRGAESVRRHRERLQDFLWQCKDGMMMNGTNGVQNWDTAFLIQAVVESNLVKGNEEVLKKALSFLECSQILEHPVGYEQSSVYSDPPTAKTNVEVGYRHPRRGAWGFSERSQGYTVSDCTAEGLKSVLTLQSMRDPADASKSLFPTMISEQRMKWAVDILLTMQNASGACSSYEPSRGSEWLEYLNAAEVFGRIMVEYDYPECTTACVTALHMFHQHYPDYRATEIERFTQRAVQWIRSHQRPDGSWYGSWAICFTYAGMFALESLATQGESHANSERVRRACNFFIQKQNEDGGWGESYKSCELGEWCHHPGGSQVVQTAWVIIALLEAEYPHREHIEPAIRLIMRRQQPNGEWLQEGIEGVFNKSCMISYPNYKFIFPIKALGMYFKRFGNAGGSRA